MKLSDKTQLGLSNPQTRLTEEKRQRKQQVEDLFRSREISQDYYNLRERGWEGDTSLMRFNSVKFYYITESTEECSRLIKVKDKVDTTIFYDVIKSEKCVKYLLGKNRFINVVKTSPTTVCIVHFDLSENWRDSFCSYIDLETGDYQIPKEVSIDLFERVIKVLMFVEYGDITVQMLKPNRSNGRTRLKGKIKNGSKEEIFTVDSKWNHILIKGDEFGVRGHFRLQACGKGKKDRKLIWIESFKKTGYTKKGGGVKLQENRYES